MSVNGWSSYQKVKQVQASAVAMISNQITGIKAVGHHFQSTPVYLDTPLSRAEDRIKRKQDKKRRD